MANPSRPLLLLHLLLLRHPSRRAAASCTSSQAAPPLSPRAAAPCPLPLHLTWLGEALSDGVLHHQRHHNRRGAEIHLAISTLLAGSRRRRSTSSRTCGYRGGAAPCGTSSDWTSRKYISSRLDESSCGDRLANPCTDKTRLLIFKGKRLDLTFATFV